MRDYQAIGPDMEAKKLYRRGWVQKTAKKKAEEWFAHVQVHSDVTGTRGVFRSVTKMLKEEGPGGWDAICHLVKFNFRKFNEKVLYRGTPYIKYNEQKGILQFLELEDFKENTQTDQWKRQKEWRGKKKAAASTAGENTEPASTAGENTNAAVKPPGKKLSEAVKKFNSAVKEVGIQYKSIIDVKTQAAALNQAMAEDASWKGLDTVEMMEGMNAAEKSLQELVATEFWKQRMLLPEKQFLKWAKTMNAAQLTKASKTAEAKTIVKNLVSEMELLREQKAVRDKHREG